MKVMVYANAGHPDSVLLLPAPGRGRRPKVLSGLTTENFEAEVGKAVAEMCRPKPTQPPFPG